MAIVIKAHYDGKVIVPDEPVDLPADTQVTAEIRTILPHSNADEIARRKAAWRRLSSRVVKGVAIPQEALRRENLYEPPRGL